MLVSFFLFFSPSSFNLGLILKPLIHLDMICDRVSDLEPVAVFYMALSIFFFWIFVEETVFFPMYIFGVFAKTQAAGSLAWVSALVLIS